MTKIYNVLFFTLAGLTFIWLVLRVQRHYALRDQSRRHKATTAVLVQDILHQSQDDHELFEIKLLDCGPGYGDLSGIAVKVDQDGIVLDILHYVSPVLQGVSIELFFRVHVNNAPQVYHCVSRILEVKNEAGHARLLLTMPADYDPALMRHFNRIRPPKEAVPALAVWPWQADRPLPRQLEAFPLPALRHSNSQEPPRLALKNISANGVGLRLDPQAIRAADRDAIQWQAGTHLLLLMRYEQEVRETGRAQAACPAPLQDKATGRACGKPAGTQNGYTGLRQTAQTGVKAALKGPKQGAGPNGQDTQTTATPPLPVKQTKALFCLCKIIYCRTESEQDLPLVVGMQIYRWSLYKNRQKDLEWFNCIPQQGVGPLLQWVTYLDLEERRRRYGKPAPFSPRPWQA